MKNRFNALAGVHGYHIHVYFDQNSEPVARQLVDDIRMLFPQDVEGIHKIGRVGPHVSPNFAVHITPESFGRIVPWLQLNGQNLPVLIHPETGDDLKDHLESSLWLNRQLGYNDAFFEKLRTPKP